MDNVNNKVYSMKNKLLLFLLFFSFLGNKLIANDLDKIVTNVKVDSELSTIGSVVDTVKNNNKPLKTGKALAIIPPPQTTAGSACIEEGELSVKVFMSASGGSGDLIEWFSDQRSENVLFTGSIFGPSLSETTTYYVQSHTGPDFSIRVPVVASVYSSPSTVTLSVSPADGTVCEGTQVIFTANGGGDLFEFSIDGIVNQAMSINRDFETLTLKKGQVVSVRTRYGVVLDGVISETAWGKGALEDNILSAPLSSSASDGYVNSIKISPTEDKLVFGIAGKLESNKSMLLFLDTKPGGFNFSNDYGDEPSDSRSVRAFNYFNNNRNSFDAYFQADFCLAISKDDVGTNYYADIIELKSGNSTKVNLGNVSPGSGSSEMAVNNSNSGSGDYSLGFEVAVLKSLIGYTVGDIKFFALTMQDSVDSYSVTNSFLSPELSISADYGSDAVDYNIKDPNPVVVSANALIPCYKEASITINLDERPTTASVGSDQSSCILTSGSLGGNTPTIGTGSWTLTSGPGVASFSNVNSGGSTATVDAEGRYVFTWTISNGVCPSSSADINVDFLIAPVMPAASDQTECALSPIQTLTATATAQADESLVWYDAATGGNTVADPSLNSLGSVTYYAESVNDASSCTSASRAAVTLTINQVPEAPVSGGDQTECASSPIQILTATATAKSGETVVWYYEATGGNIALDPSLSSLGTYTFYAESVNDATSCVSASRTGVTLTLNSGPEPPVSGGDLTECTDRTSTQTLTATAEGDSISWYTIAVGGNTVSDPTQVGVGTSTYYAESSNGVCPSLTRTPVTLTIVGVVPNATANDETICSDGKSDQTITAIAVGNTITWYTDLTGGDVVSSPTQVGVGTATYYAESSIGNCVSESRTKVVLTITPTPSTPTATVSKQPTCTDSNGEIIIDSQSGVEYSIGDAFQDSPIFTDLESGSYTISVRFKDNAPCEVKGAVKIINPIPAEIQFESTGDCINKEYIITALPLESSYDLNNVDYQWKDNLGNDVGTNSNTLNVSDIIASSSAEITFPLNYTLTITSIATGCETTGNIFIESAFCNIQKGISPDGNGSNDYFDLRLMDVKKLEIFDRYGITVYSQINYSDQWKGQSDKGTELPSATYYYVIHFNNAKLFKTGWIYLIR
jgi:gliding motility-associated-like protein